jgi:hypothetical protein
LEAAVEVSPKDIDEALEHLAEKKAIAIDNK